jgi:hypothetical protein
MTTNKSSKETTRRKRQAAGATKHAQPSAHALPAVDYEPIIRACEPEIAARTSVAGLAPQYQTAEHKARLVAESVTGLRARFAEWRTLGDFYAAALASDDTTAAVHNILADELDDLVSAAGLSITHPDVLRLLYPLLRWRIHLQQRAV